MKITKSTLKQIIKEEIKHIKEVDIPFSSPGQRPGIPSASRPAASGPEAVGDLVSQALYNSISFLEDLLSDKEIGSLSGGYYKERAKKLQDQITHAKTALRSAHLANIDK